MHSTSNDIQTFKDGPVWRDLREHLEGSLTIMVNTMIDTEDDVLATKMRYEAKVLKDSLKLPELLEKKRKAQDVADTIRAANA